MTALAAPHYEITLEIGEKKVFAGAVDWPGWCRSGRDENSALLALVEYGPRYARALQLARLEFIPPAEPAGLAVITRAPGNTTTDFGAPDLPAPGDGLPVSPGELQRLETILKAAWLAFDQAAQQAAGRTLRTGPRGGGRNLEKMTTHVFEAEMAYLRSLGWQAAIPEGEASLRMERVRVECLRGMQTAAAGQIAAVGPRGGQRWTVRSFVRRAAWHVLDHAWEIEDRIQD